MPEVVRLRSLLYSINFLEGFSSAYNMARGDEAHLMAPLPTQAAPLKVALRILLGELARLFLKLRTIALGGPAAHIAMMEDEVVRRRRWLTREQFLDYLGALGRDGTEVERGRISKLPLTEMAIHIGHARAGWAGLVVAGSGFILPAVAIVTAPGDACITGAPGGAGFPLRRQAGRDCRRAASPMVSGPLGREIAVARDRYIWHTKVAAAKVRL